MASFGLIAHRPVEDLVLDDNGNGKIPGKFVQYLFSHQINGLRFLYNSCKSQNSCILNDEEGLGKCFQAIAFLNTIVASQQTKYILIACRDKDRILHWMYHLELLTDGIKCVIADNAESEDFFKNVDNSRGIVIAATLNCILKHSDTFRNHDFDCMILDDKTQEISSDEFEMLKQLKVNKKIMICCHDIMTNLKYFYIILKFCDQTQPLASSQSENKCLNIKEFGKKYGSTDDDKSLSQRSIILRQRNLLNMCKEFYLRRLRHQYSFQLPLIEPGTFQRNFDRWKLAYSDTEPFIEETSSSPDWPNSSGNDPSVSTETDKNSSGTEINFTPPIERFASFQSVHVDNDNTSECQMSPLIYYNSDSELDTPKKVINEEAGEDVKKSDTANKICTPQSSKDSDHKTSDSSESTIQAGQVIPTNLNDSDDLFGDIKSQELAVQENQNCIKEIDKSYGNLRTPKKQESWIKQQTSSYRTCSSTTTNRISKKTKSGIYREIKLEIKTTPKKTAATENRARLRKVNDKSIFDKVIDRHAPNRFSEEESISMFSSLIRQSGLRKQSAPDVQIITQKTLSPITVRSSSSESKQYTKNNFNCTDDAETNFNSEMLSSSPDLFKSVNETLKNVSNATDKSQIVDENKRSDERSNLNETEDDILGHKDFTLKLLDESTSAKGSLSKLFNESKSKSNDIFEITRNNVFHNVLRVWSDTAISPIVKSTPNTSVSRAPSCFSGLKISAPKLSNNSEIAGPSETVQSNDSKSTKTKVTEAVIDLTATSTPLIFIDDSEKSINGSSSEDAEIISNSLSTPERKQPLTPSTRSCLKRVAEANNEPDTKIVAKTDSPNKPRWLSKRNLDKRPMTNVTPKTRRTLKFPQSQSIKPRNILNDLKAPENLHRTRPEKIKLSGTESPNIMFSSEED